MRLSVRQTESGPVVVIQVGERLDVSRTRLLVQAAERAAQSMVSRVVIDFDGTVRLFDSGLAILRLLQQRLGAQHRRSDDRLWTINCSEALHLRLRDAGFFPRSFTRESL